MILLSAALILICGLSLPAGSLVKPGVKLPPLELPDTGGQRHALADLTKDKVSVLVYWSISCPDCKREMPRLLALGRRLTGNPFIMLLINSDGPDMVEAARTYAQGYNMPEPVLRDEGPNDSLPLADVFDIKGTPTVLVLDKKGVLIQAQQIKIDMPKLTQAIEAAF
ncbi:MAG: TlpA disulfide reductase family protein [Desulfarculaceae bacterium]|jgi:thiol-disulfide isomerase/thioredoxin